MSELYPGVAADAGAADADEDAFFARQVRVLYGASRYVLPFNLLLGATLVLALWKESSPAALIAWLAALSVVAGLRFALAQAYLRVGRPRAAVWLRYFTGAAALNGAVWGLCVPVLAVKDSVISLGFASLWPCGIAAGAPS